MMKKLTLLIEASLNLSVSPLIFSKKITCEENKSSSELSQSSPSYQYFEVLVKTSDAEFAWLNSTELINSSV